MDNSKKKVSDQSHNGTIAIGNEVVFRAKLFPPPLSKKCTLHNEGKWCCVRRGENSCICWSHFSKAIFVSIKWFFPTTPSLFRAPRGEKPRYLRTNGRRELHLQFCEQERGKEWESGGARFYAVFFFSLYTYSLCLRLTDLFTHPLAVVV